jgi:sensor domain CHASE-containing protein
LDTQTATAVGVPVILAVVWLIRLEGRVNTQDALHRELKEDVTYIRSRIDRAINGHGA